MFNKIKVQITFHSGRQVTFKCRKFTIDKYGNELLSYWASGTSKQTNDLLTYVKLDSIDHIATKKVFW